MKMESKSSKMNITNSSLVIKIVLRVLNSKKIFGTTTKCRISSVLMTRASICRELETVDRRNSQAKP